MTVKRSLFRSAVSLFVLLAVSGAFADSCVTLDDINNEIKALGTGFTTDVSVVYKLINDLKIKANDGNSLASKFSTDDNKVFSDLTKDADNWEAFGYVTASDADRKRLVAQVQTLVDLGDVIVVAQNSAGTPPKGGQVALIVADPNPSATSASAAWETMKIEVRGAKNTDPATTVLLSTRFKTTDAKSIDFFRCRQ